jgi:hypothetical protein
VATSVSTSRRSAITFVYLALYAWITPMGIVYMSAEHMYDNSNENTMNIAKDVSKTRALLQQSTGCEDTKEDFVVPKVLVRPGQYWLRPTKGRKRSNVGSDFAPQVERGPERAVKRWSDKTFTTMIDRDLSYLRRKKCPHGRSVQHLDANRLLNSNHQKTVSCPRMARLHTSLQPNIISCGASNLVFLL